MSRCPELMGLAEVAQELRRSMTTIRNWRDRRPDFPEPVAKLVGGHIWLAEDIRAFAETAARVPRLRRRSPVFNSGEFQ
jgi:hypothetical protein